MQINSDNQRAIPQVEQLNDMLLRLCTWSTALPAQLVDGLLKAYCTCTASEATATIGQADTPPRDQQLSSILASAEQRQQLAGVVSLSAELRDQLLDFIQSGQDQSDIETADIAISSGVITEPEATASHTDAHVCGNDIALTTSLGGAASAMHVLPPMPTTGILENDFTIRVDHEKRPILVGSGGMGYVVIGDPTVPGPPKAIKVCRDGQHEPRMLREFEVLRRLDFAHYPSGDRLYRDTHGRLCYSMKLVQGVSLAALYKAFHRFAQDPQCEDPSSADLLEQYLLVSRPKGGFSQQDLNEAFKGLYSRLIAVATAVSTMHAEGFIHRDLKPDNVRIESKTREAFLLDFGLAKTQGDADLPADTKEMSISDLTQIGSIMGTFAYMSPEQASGNSDTHGRATDIYALGAMLYLLIAGKPALEERTARGERHNIAGILEQIRSGQIKPPIRLSTIHAKFPDLEAICLKAMAKDPHSRYSSVEEMICDLRAWSSGYSVNAYRDSIRGLRSLQYDFFHWRQRNTGLWNAIRTAVFGSLTFVGLGGLYSASENTKASAVANIAQRSLSGISGEINEGLARLLGSHTVETVPVEMLDQLFSRGDLRAFFRSTRKRLRDEILQGGSAPMFRYAQHTAVRSVIEDAKAADENLGSMEAIFERRCSVRLEALRELEEFRREFAPIRDFLGNDLGLSLSGTPQERIDSALSRFLPLFKRSSEQSEPGQTTSLFFPACTGDVTKLLLELPLSNRELSETEVREILESVATLLTYKVVNLKYNAASGYPLESLPYLKTALQYLTDAQRLRGGQPLSYYDLVYWDRVERGLKGDSSSDIKEQLSSVEDAAIGADLSRLAFSSRDFGALGRRLDELYQHEAALRVFEHLLSTLQAPQSQQMSISPSLFLGEFETGVALLNLAWNQSSADQGRDSLQKASDAYGAFSRALGILSSLPNDHRDKSALLGAVYLRLANTKSLICLLLGNEASDRKEVDALWRKAEDLNPSSNLYRVWGMALVALDEVEAAIEKLTKAMDLEPALEEMTTPWLALLSAKKGDEQRLIEFATRTLARSKNRAENGGLPAEPLGLFVAAMAVTEYQSRVAAELSSEKMHLLEDTTYELLGEVLASCRRGQPFKLDQIDVSRWESFLPLRAKNPEFFQNFERETRLLNSQPRR